MANNYQLALKDAVTKIKDKRKDKWGRSKQTIYRIYGKERCINEWGSKLPTPIEIQEYKQNCVKKALDDDNVYKDTIVVRDPPTFIILKLYFFEGKG